MSDAPISEPLYTHQMGTITFQGTRDDMRNWGAPVAPAPARILAVAVMIGQVLDDLSHRDPAGLSRSEDDFLACIGPIGADLAAIATQAREEMGVQAVNILRTGSVDGTAV